jgi:hypothetical protein
MWRQLPRVAIKTFAANTGQTVDNGAEGAQDGLPSRLINGEKMGAAL